MAVRERRRNTGRRPQRDRQPMELQEEGSLEDMTEQERAEALMTGGILEIVDDGTGFESGRAREFLRMGRVGLASMRERVELASGTFVVRSMPGRGTTIVATLPLDNVPVGQALSINDAT